MRRHITQIHFHLLIAAVSILLLNGCTESHYSSGIVGRPAMSTDGKFVTVLIAVCNITTKQENGGYRSSEYNTSYWLHKYETGTGKKVKQKKIVTDAEKNNLQVICYGGFGDKIWLHTTGLAAYDINSLEEKVNENTLSVENGINKNDFPVDDRFIEEKVSEGYIRFINMNKEPFRIDLSTLKIISEKEIKKQVNDKNNIQSQLHLLHTNRYGVRNDTAGNTMFILAKDSITAMNSYPGNGDDEPLYKKLCVFKAGYTTSRVGNHSFYRYSNLKQLRGASYLNAVFLKDFSTEQVVKLYAPGAYVILHNDSLNNTSRSILTAIDENNNSIWQTDTGLSTRLSNCIAGNNLCILTGNRHSLVGPPVGYDMLCLIDLKNGKLVTILMED